MTFFTGESYQDLRNYNTNQTHNLSKIEKKGTFSSSFYSDTKVADKDITRNYRPIPFMNINAKILYQNINWIQ